MLRAWLTVVALLIATPTIAASLIFHGNGTGDIDRVKIRIDDPQNNNPGPPADIGATDFTIEFWMRPATGNNAGAGVSCGADYSWINGNIVFDRDRYDQGSAFGIALANGRVAFGIKNSSGSSRTICGTTDLRAGNRWYHVAVQRQTGGLMEIYVDGQREAFANGPTGDISYPNNGIPSSTACGGPCTNSDPFIVLGAEKHDAPGYLSYRGGFTELRLSTTRRYSANFTVPTARFSVDGLTAALYHFVDDFGTNQIVDAVGNGSPGVRNVGGNPPGPEWSTDSPFGSTPPPTSAGTVQLSQANYTVAEQNTNFTISVTRTGGSSGVATVDYAVSAGTATAGADFDATSGTLTWANGEQGTKTFTILIRDDNDPEPNETITIQLSNATGSTLGTPTSAVLTVTDNDAATGNPPPPGSGGDNGGGSSGGGGGGGALDWLTLVLLALAMGTSMRLRSRPLDRRSQ
jgi:hypothetical protein